MIQKCPKCGQWCETEKDSLADSHLDKGSLKKLGILSLSISPLAAVAGGISKLVSGDSYLFHCSNCGHEWSCDSESEDQSKEYHHHQDINNLANQLRAIDTTDTVAISDFNKQISERLQSATNSDARSALLAVRSVLHWLSNDLNSAYNDISNSLRIQNNPHFRAMRGVYLAEINHSKPNPTAKSVVDAITDLTSIYDEEHLDLYIPASRLETALESGIADYVDQFVNLLPSERRFICFTDKIKGIGKNILVLPLGKVPQGITFQEGLPRKNVIYEVHPFKPNHYINLENFDFELFNDKISEFQWIMENLGARKISVSIENNQSQTTDRKSHLDVHAEGEYNGFGAGVGYKNDSTSKMYNDLYLRVEQNSNFDQSNNPPQLPEDLIWYPHSPEWKRKVESRLSGRVNSFEEEFDSMSNQSITETEALELEAEMKYLMARVKGKFGTATDYHLTKSDNYKWKVKVEFYPLKNYDNASKKSPAFSQILLTADEQDYIDTYSDFIKDGIITDRERRLLDKISSHAGLTKERVKVLETFAAQRLNQ